MKIINRKVSDFADVKVGECFYVTGDSGPSHQDLLYKTASHTNFNCICLGTAALWHLPPNARVRVVDTEVVVRN